jgi:hypothetical protein
VILTRELLAVVLLKNAAPPARAPIAELKAALLEFTEGHVPFIVSEKAPTET